MSFAHPAGHSGAHADSAPAARPGHAPHGLPLRVGTRASPLALAQTRAFLRVLTAFCPVLRQMEAFEEHAIRTTGDATQATGERLADIGGKGLFAKEIHEALLDRRIDFAVHSLKDLETEMPPGIALACTLAREDARDVLILGPGCGPPDLSAPLAALPARALIGTSSVRRQAQLLHARPDLAVATLRGNVRTRLDRVRRGDVTASLLALAGLRRLGLDDGVERGEMLVLDPDAMVPAAGQGIVGVTVRADDTHLRELLAAIEDPVAHAVATAERALLAALDGSCHTPIGGHARLLPDAGAAGGPGALILTGLVARTDGSFLLKRTIVGAPGDAARIGDELGRSLRADCPVDLFA